MEKAKTKLTESVPAKIAAFILVIVFVCACAASVAAVVANYSFDTYQNSSDDMKNDFLGDYAYSSADNILRTYLYEGEDEALKSCEGTNLSFSIYDSEGNLLCGTPEDEDSAYIFTSTAEMPTSESSVYERYTVNTYVDKQFSEKDEYSFTNGVVDLIYAMR